MHLQEKEKKAILYFTLIAWLRLITENVFLGLDIKVHDILLRKTKNNLIELQYAFEHGLEELHNNNTSQNFNKVKSRLMMQLL